MTKPKQKKEEQEAKKKDKQGSTSAKEVAEAMAANMAANQVDPDFELKREARNREAAEYALKKNKKQLADAGVHIPGVTEDPEKKP